MIDNHIDNNIGGGAQAEYNRRRASELDLLEAAHRREMEAVEVCKQGVRVSGC
jgi:hypothetical protein